MSDLKPYEEALKQLLQFVQVNKKINTIPIHQSLNKILAKPIYSPINVPAIANSMMDGYGVKLSSIQTDTPYPITQTIAAGEVGVPLEAGSVVRILTGAAIPEGVDCVVKQEWATQVSYEGKICVQFTQLPDGEGANIRQIGEDISQGRVVLDQGKRLQPEDIGMLAAIGQSHIQVYQPLTIATFTTGDELLEPGDAPQIGKIYNTNRYMLQALLQQYGFEVIDFGRIRDHLESLTHTLKMAAEQSDVIITTGGVSVGDRDLIKPAIEQLGKLKMWKVAIKPGKPLAYGELLDTPFIGLPGNPVAAFATFYLFARPFLLKMQGMDQVIMDYGCISSGFDWPKSSSRREFLRVKIEHHHHCEVAIPYPNQGAGILSSIVEADGFAMIPENTTVKKGDPITLIRFNELR